jgi:hypothetical protein
MARTFTARRPLCFLPTGFRNSGGLTVANTETILSDYITRPKLAKQLRKSVFTLWRWEKGEVGPAVTKIGRDPYYHIDAVRDWLKSRQTETVDKKSTARRKRPRAA